MFNNTKKANAKNVFGWKVFHSKKEIIKPLILDQVRKNQTVIHGAFALNQHLPPFLRKHTADIDIFSKKPKQSAKQLEQTLDKAFGLDLFEVKRGTTKSTYKVISKVTKKSVADFTKPKTKLQITKSFDGVNFVTLPHIKDKIEKLLRDAKVKFRHDQDRETLKRIKVLELIRGKL